MRLKSPPGAIKNILQSETDGEVDAVWDRFSRFANGETENVIGVLELCLSPVCPWLVADCSSFLGGEIFTFVGSTGKLSQFCSVVSGRILWPASESRRRL